MDPVSRTNDDRTAKLARYVALDALEMLIRRIADFADIDALAVLSPSHDIELADSGDLFSSLWPDEADEGTGPLHPESVEAVLSGARSDALVARILTRLATDDGRKWMLDDATELTGMAASKTASATVKLAIEGSVSAHV